MRFGVFVPQGWKMDLVDFDRGPNKYAALRRVAKEADRLAYDSLWVYDHFHTVPVPSLEATFECWTLMAALAVETQRIRLGQMVTCNSYRPPSLLAKVSANVDVISHGRLDFGIGGGWYEHEYLAYGYPFPPVGERLRQMEEAIQVITAMWTQDHARFQGRYYHVDGAFNEPKPVQTPHPPIWVGGSGEKVTLRIVAQRGDASNFGGPVEEVQRLCQVLQGHCRSLGRNYDELTRSTSIEPLIIAETEKEAKALADRAGVSLQDTIGGTPEQCIERIRAYERVGINYLICYFQDVARDLAPLRLFAEQVIPAFQ
ncbi:MAG TPA: LLM class F420-dependent oxidoreductase [Candidatus Eisenbacteria bacterium]|nr:LLM class F420-dependent oxidoreductase [Candidatus Eisenbacteria bacterium]